MDLILPGWTQKYVLCLYSSEDMIDCPMLYTVYCTVLFMSWLEICDG